MFAHWQVKNKQTLFKTSLFTSVLIMSREKVFKILCQLGRRLQELCESRGGRPGLPSLIVLMVSVDVKQHLKKAETLLTAIQVQPTVQNHLLSVNSGTIEVRLVVHGRGKTKSEKGSGKSLKHVGATILLSDCTSVAEPQVSSC